MSLSIALFMSFLWVSSSILIRAFIPLETVRWVRCVVIVLAPFMPLIYLVFATFSQFIGDNNAHKD